MQEESDRKSEDSQNSNIVAEAQDNRLNSLVQRNLERRQTLGLSFSGRISSGLFKDESTLSVFYALKAGPRWEHVGGQPSGMSQLSTCAEESIVWNFPFSATYSSTEVVGWPKLTLVFYGTDYLGRSVSKAYANMFIPRGQGVHKRRVKVFKSLQPSSVWNCLHLVTGSPHEIEKAESILSEGELRSNLIVEYGGQVEVEVEVKRINFQKFGYH